MAAYIRNTFPGVEVTMAFGYTLFFVGAERQLPFATLAAADNDADRVSALDRPGVYRLNLGVSRETYHALFGAARPRLGRAGVVEGHDFTVLDRILPHPHYAPRGWVCVLSPGEETLGMVRGLLREAYDRASRRAARRQARST